MSNEPHPARAPLILLGICGGVAAYKAVDVASRLRKGGCEVHVAMTGAARAFVTPLTFAAVSGNAVLDRLLPADGASGEATYPHLYPATRADAFIVLPATANTIAKIAHGLASDIVSACALSLPHHCSRFFCPAMNVEMWRNPLVQENVKLLEQRGWLRIGPEAGPLACGMDGEGRMSEPADIVERVLARLRAPRPLGGRRVLILSGPTREYVDPVRFIGNASSGKMGRALAEAAAEAGAVVDFITGPVADEQLPRLPGIEITRIVSADDLLSAARARFDRADIVIYAAAIADYRPSAAHSEKLPKHDGPLTLQLEPTPDVAATLNANKRPGQLAIGFALQTSDGFSKAAEKMARKSFDGIVLNGLDALGGDSGRYTWIAPGAPPEDWGQLSKSECARRILARATARLS
jgi:phosphopantothenoylcysteine decarboxylase/phosphopantothenate--cysteine ligase